MLDVIFVPVAVLYFVVVGLLFVYGLNFFQLSLLTWRYRRMRLEPPPIDTWPRVTVQLPIYNELYVAERLIDAAAALDYPVDLLDIQVLDDSNDETIDIVANAVERWRQLGLQIVQVRRESRVGYKAGALQHALATAHGEFIAIFDADFLPQPDFLRLTVPHFQTSGIAFIQTRWGHVNREHSILTIFQSLAIDAHFMVEQFARFRAGYWFNFNGTAGIWRKEALEDAGGWTADTLTEDLDLSYRAFLRGWRALYLRDVVVPAELPVAFSAYRRQQHRWARGSLECAIKLLPEVWQAGVPFRQKVQATLHLTGYGVHFLLCALSLLYPFVLILSQRYPNLISLFGFALIFNCAAFAPMLFFVVAQQQMGRNWLRLLPVILFTTAVGAGLMLNTVRAGLQIFSGTQGVFLRTPKFGVTDKQREWTSRLYQVKLDRIVGAELLLAALNIVTVVLALTLQNWSIAFYGALFVIGLMFTSRLSISQAIAIRRGQPGSGS